MTNLNDAEKLAELNQAVDNAITARRQWLDKQMLEQSPLQIGEDIYDLRTREKLGKVVKLYRFWTEQYGGINDKFLHIEYKYEVSPNCFDNTSRQPEQMFGNLDQANEYANSKHRVQTMR